MSPPQLVSRFPGRLEDLVGTYLDELPLDPYSGRTFQYLPKGFPQPASEQDLAGWQQIRARQNVPKGPCIWASGPKLVLKELSAGVVVGELQVPLYYDSPNGFRPLSAFEVWARGMVFPIPETH